MMSGTSREEENEEDGISIKAPPSDAFSKLSLMEIVLPEEDDATSEGKPRENEKDDKGEVNGQTDDETACRRAKELLSHELPTFVTPLSASVLEICILALYVYVNSSEATTRTTTKPPTSKQISASRSCNPPHHASSKHNISSCSPLDRLADVQA